MINLRRFLGLLCFAAILSLPFISAALATDDAGQPADGTDNPVVKPDRAERLELGGYSQVRYQEGGEAGSFSIRRARVQLKGRLNRDIRFELDTDLADLGLTDTVGSARALKDVVLEARPYPKLWIRAGQFKKSFLLEEATSSRNLPIIERGLLSDHLRDLGYAGRDVGVEASYSAERNEWEADLGLAFMNGEGPNQGRLSDGMNDVVLNLSLERKGIGRLIGAMQWKVRPDAPGSEEEKAIAYSLGLVLEWRSLEFEGEWLGWDIDPEDSISEFNDTGFGLWGMASWNSPRNFLGLYKIEFGLRAEKLEPNESRERGRGDILSRWTPSMTLFLHKFSRIRVGPQIDWFQDPAYDTTTTWMAEWQLSY